MQNLRYEPRLLQIYNTISLLTGLKLIHVYSSHNCLRLLFK